MPSPTPVRASSRVDVPARADAPSGIALAHRAQPSPKPPGAVRRSYAPELLANCRRRYEQSAESSTTIATDLGIHPHSLGRLARREGWVRFVSPPRELPQAARILQEAETLVAAAAEQAARSNAVAADRDRERAETAASAQPDLSPVERLERAVLAELATVEAMRAQLGRAPSTPSDAVRTAQTLSSLTETLHKIQRLRCGLAPVEPDHDDDMPADIDEFRRELARRIDAFVASRTEPGNAEGAAESGSTMVAPV